MNITFLIGNGFDLNLGLATTFSAFLEDYCKIAAPDSSEIQYFKTQILKDTALWSSAEVAFGKSTKKFHDDKYDAEAYCTCHEDFCVKLAEYLLKQEQRLNYTALNDVIVNAFGKGLLNYKSGFRETETAKILAAESAISRGFIFNFINFNYTSTLDLCVSAVQSRVRFLGSRTVGNTAFENKLGKVLHVHGTALKDMVLGVNDISQIDDPSLFEGYDEEYINEIIKQKTNENNEEDMDTKVKNLLETSDLIYVYGMSTGVTDKLWWVRICELMAKKKGLHLILHKYDAPDDRLIRRAYRLFAASVKKEFTAYCDLDEATKQDIESRIHMTKHNIFSGLSELVNNKANTAKDPVSV